MMLGYWNRPELSEQVFGVEVNGTTFLRTGDLGYLRDGEVFICGRKKDLIISGGFNVYPGEVEQVGGGHVVRVGRVPRVRLVVVAQHLVVKGRAPCRGAAVECIVEPQAVATIPPTHRQVIRFR